MSININNLTDIHKNNYLTDNCLTKNKQDSENYLFDNMDNFNETEELSRKRDGKYHDEPPPPPPPPKDGHHPHKPPHDKHHHKRDDDYIVIRIGGVEFIIKKKDAELNTTKET